MIVFPSFVLFFTLLFSRQIRGHLYDPEGWMAASKYLKETLDHTIDPCNDFYGFVCAKWNKSFGSDSIHYEFDRARQYVTDRLISVLKSPDTKFDDNDPKSAYKRSLKYFYDQCTAKPYKDDEALIRFKIASFDSSLLNDFVH
uniref:Peptidase M13 N-terminal domain-containing protein n=1 Tax=Romanomermis culicivorax TaxID=13658 RepID=A0A915I233_ROMCU